jgi:hypothetical protein
MRSYGLRFCAHGVCSARLQPFELVDGVSGR